MPSVYLFTSRHLINSSPLSIGNVNFIHPCQFVDESYDFCHGKCSGEQVGEAECRVGCQKLSPGLFYRPPRPPPSKDFKQIKKRVQCLF